MSGLKTWLLGHRELLGYILGFIAAGLAGTGHPQIAAGLAPVATWLHGAGAAESDAYHNGK